MNHKLFENETFEELPESIYCSNFINCVIKATSTFDRCNLEGCQIKKEGTFIKSNLIEVSFGRGIKNKCVFEKSNVEEEEEAAQA